MRFGALIFSLIILSSFTACAEVKPWQKGNLAKWHMALTPDPLNHAYRQHMHFSKEGMVGGYGLGGGGCGCN